MKKNNGHVVGFVPTMGALHPGHISLVETSRNSCSLTIASIFVNPTQFNDKKDFEKYPVTIEKDIALLESAGCDVLFLPSVEEMYPNGFGHSAKYELGELETKWEGKFRPGHFQGVCQIVDRLLSIVSPHELYLGQKDFQQCLVIRKLLGNSGIDLKICPTLREPDGLAMSSRNTRLNTQERAKATVIYKCLSMIASEIKPGPVNYLIEKAASLLTNAGFRVDYVAITDTVMLEPVMNWDGKQELVVLIAAFNNEVRLIDNMIIFPQSNTP